MSERGLYIVGEGADFSGKTTQMNLIKDAWKDRDDVVYVREPGGTPYAEQVRQVIFFPAENISALNEVLLFTSARLDLYERVIAPALAEGKTVLSDRNWYSTLAYQSAGGNIPAKRVEEVTRQFLPERYMQPDLTFVMTVTSEERRKRKAARAYQDGAQDAIEKQDDEYFERVAKLYQGYIIRDLGAKAISGMGDPLDIHHRIMSEIT